MVKVNPEKCVTCSFGPPAWRYNCLECKNVFEMPSPRGPADEKSRTCPACRSKAIERVNLVKSESCPPGG